MASARRPVPEFRSETEERAFWDSHDTVDYVDWAQAVVAGFPNLKPSSSTISLRLPALPNKRVRRATARSPSRKSTKLAGKAHRR